MRQFLRQGQRGVAWTGPPQGAGSASRPSRPPTRLDDDAEGREPARESKGFVPNEAPFSATDMMFANGMKSPFQRERDRFLAIERRSGDPCMQA
jgi:hypothetical protein